MAGTVRNLKQRMDNLTTEEVFRGMADQFMSAYPGAKEFQATVGALQAMDANLEARLEASDSKVNMLHGNQTDLRRKLDELANRVFEGQVRTSDVEEEVKVLRKDVDRLEASMADARKDFDTAMGLQTGVIIEVRHQVQAFADNAFGPSHD
jgi:chromosome segregation ATPase